MPSLKQQLTNIFSDAFAVCGFDRKFGEVVVSQRPDLSQFQCNGALPAAHSQKRNPREVAQLVLDAISDKSIFKDLSIAGPGFINITLTDEFLAQHLQQMQDDKQLLHTSVSQRKNVIIDFGAPNIAKPMHVGHLRTTIIGDCLQRLFRYMGDNVTSDTHLGDWGTQMGMLICELKRHQPDLPYFDINYTGDYPATSPVSLTDLETLYPAASARCKSDAEALQAAQQATVELQQGRRGYRALWQHFIDVSLGALKTDYEQLGVSFDLWYGESRYNDRIPALIKRMQASGKVQESEGALIVAVAQDSDKNPMPPLILVKSDGGYLYSTTDLATLEERVDDLQADVILYVVDSRQSLHFEQVFRAARLTGIARNVALEHIAYGTVNGKDGKPFKTRTGGVMQLQTLISMALEEAQQRMQEAGIAQDYTAQEKTDIANKVGIAALKFADLINYRTSDYIFDLEKFTRFEGKTGPYLLYAAIRIKSILRKAKEQGFAPGIIQPAAGSEREFMLELCKYPEALQEAYIERAPNYLCEYAYNLAQNFSRFYQACHILKEEDAARRSSWLALAQLCLKQLEQILDLLGIAIPERM